MDEAKRQERNQQKLQELYPAFAARVKTVIETLESAGLRPRIQDAWRSPADQLIAFQKGNAKVKYGFHNVTGPSGRKESLAVDLLDDDNPLNSARPYLLQLAAAAQAAGTSSGIRWGVPAKLITGIDEAIANKDWDAPVKIGWDPTHIQPVGVTIAEAKAGKRPS